MSELFSKLKYPAFNYFFGIITGVLIFTLIEGIDYGTLRIGFVFATLTTLFCGAVFWTTSFPKTDIAKSIVNLASNVPLRNSQEAAPPQNTTDYRKPCPECGNKTKHKAGCSIWQKKQEMKKQSPQ